MDDRLAMAEYRMTGEAFTGIVTAVEPGRIDGTGRRRKLRPQITVATQDPLRGEAGHTLRSPDRPGQSVLGVSVSPGRPCDVLLELSGGMGRGPTPPPGSGPAGGDPGPHPPPSA